MCIKQICPVDKKESPIWFFQSSRLILSLFFIIFPMAFQQAVPEVGADPKWILAHTVSLFLSALLFASWFQSKPTIKLKWPISVWAMIIFSIFIILSFIDAYNPYKSWWFLKHWISYSLIFFLIYNLRNEDWYKTILAILIIPFTFNSILGICHFFVITDANITNIFPLWEYVSPFIDRFKQSAPPAATFANKNLAASYTVMMLPIALYALFTWKHKITQCLAAISFTLGAIFLVYTRSRGSWLAGIAALTFLIIWIFAIPKNRELVISICSRYKILLLILSIVTTIGAAQFQSNVDARYHSVGESVSNQFSSISRMGKNDVGTRIAYYLNSAKIIADHPFNGIGLANFQTIYPKYHHVFYETPKIGYAVEARPQRVHNDFIQAFVETGIIGGLAFITIFLSTFYMGWKFSRSSASANIRITSIFILTSITGVGFNALGDFPFQMPAVPVISWALIAILTGLYTFTFKEKASVGFNIKLKVPAIVFAIIGASLFIILVKVFNDDLARNEASIKMKYVMSYSAANIFNDKVLDTLEEAHEMYPYNSRTEEYRGTIPVNYKGKRKLSLDNLITLGENALKYDPYAPNNLINLGGTYFRKSMQAEKLGDSRIAIKYADKILDVYKRLLPLAYFSPHTYTLAGYAYLIKEKPNKSIALFNKALEKNPKYVPAVTGRSLSIQALKIEGHSQEAIDIMLGKKAPPIGLFRKDIFDKLKTGAPKQ